MPNLTWTLLGAVLIAAPAMSSDRMIAAHDVLAVITADWTGDGGMDRAVLANNGDGMADLMIYSEQDGTMALVAATEAIAWVGGSWGTLPELALSPTGALQVISMNEAIGRNRWRETVTIAYRDGGFIVAGYTYIAYDTLNLDYEYGCDINLITRKGIFNRTRFRSPISAVLVDEWAAQKASPDDLCPKE